MKKLFFLMSIAAVAMTSCSNDESLSINRGEEISFRSAMGTRGSETAIGNLQGADGFLVTALNAEKTGAYFDKVAFTYEEGTYTSSTDYYWPANDEALNFYAWYPGDSISPELASGTGMTFNYTVADAIANQLDVVVADALDKKKPVDNAGVSLTFKHALSQIEIMAKNDNAAYTVKVKSVKIAQIPSTGTGFSVKTEVAAPTAVSEKKTFTVPEFSVLTLNATAESLMDGGGNAFLIPQTLAGWNPTDKKNTAEGAYISVLVDINAAAGANIYPKTADKFAWAAIPISDTWAPNTKYTYTLNFGAGAGKVDPEEDDDDEEPWKPGDDIIDTDEDAVIKFVTVTVVPMTETTKNPDMK